MYRDEPEWRTLLGPKERFYESIGGHEDPLAEQIRQITEWDELDRYANRKAHELLQILDVIRGFRDQLHEAFVGNVVRLASTMSTEVQEFVRSVTGLAAQDAQQEMLEALNDRGEDIQSP